MSINKHYECASCDAVFKIKHDLDSNYYTISNCAFCGESLDREEDGYELDDDIDTDE